MSAKTCFIVSLALVAVLWADPSWAIINQVDGTIVPQTPALQSCLDKSPTASGANPAPGEGAGVLNAVRDAAVSPEVFLPAPRSDGRRVVAFTAIGEGAGYQNRFGWYNVGDAPFAGSNRREVFDCRGGGSCACPCLGGPRPTLRPEGMCTHWVNPNIVEIDFDCHRAAGRWRGGPIAFYIMTPELVAGGGAGCPPVDSTVHRIYSTDNSVNDDGDFVHYLVFRSRSFVNAYYFGFEDLFRGGDNDFEDLLVRAVGLVPTCNPSPEVCDGRDNNCNGLVDDGLGETLCGVGACRVSSANCQGGRVQVCAPRAPTVEICNNLDDDCNGEIDDGVTRPCVGACGAGVQYCSVGRFGDCVAQTPAAEVCDGRDNDCNGMIDEGLTRPCRTSCGPGVETCEGGAFVRCTAPTAVPEICNGLDDNCNGLTDDGVAPRPCRSACGAGTESCIGGTFVCNAPLPRPEVCDGIDNDCNSLVDDSVPEGGTCGSATSACRTGRFECIAGRYVCQGATVGAAETCNGVDDNCNGVVDEGDPGGGAPCGTSPSGQRLCSPGTMRCRGGALRCEGGTAGTPEVCNCRDDDCDGVSDPPGTASASLCPGAGRCISCACRSPCLPGEFPCSPGLYCNAQNFCVTPMCGALTCRDDQVCVSERCVDPCAATRCPSGQVCRLREGRAGCVEDNCYGLGCVGAQLCLAGRCVNNPCFGRLCSPGSFCRPETDGSARCVASCGDILCPLGQSCTDGVCARDPCRGHPCSAGQVCRAPRGAAECLRDPCANMGPRPGRTCVDGRFIDDPCESVRCPGAPRVQCSLGQCVDPQAEPLVRDRVLGSGGDCTVSPPGSSVQRVWMLWVLAGLSLRRARTLRVRRGAR